MTWLNAPRLGALVCTALSLAACSGAQERANSNICYDFKAKAAPIPATDLAGGVDDCARRWAYSLASSADDAESVADAVVGACHTPLIKWNQQSMGATEAPAGDATSIITGEATTPINEHMNFLRSRALLHVVQARAGNCTPPPAKDGLPEGLAAG